MKRCNSPGALIAAALKRKRKAVDVPKSVKTAMRTGHADMEVRRWAISVLGIDAAEINKLASDYELGVW